MPPRPPSQELFGLGHAQDLLARHGSDHVRMLVLDVLLDVADDLVVRLAADRLAARAIDLHRHSGLLSDLRKTTLRRRAGRAPALQRPARPPSSIGPCPLPPPRRRSPQRNGR